MDKEVEKYWQESWIATVVLVMLTVWANLIFVVCGLLYLFFTKGTNNREKLAWRKLIKRTVIIDGVILLLAVILILVSLLPLLSDI